MRKIEISTDVFAAIWQHRLDGENTEDDVLKRLLGISLRADPPKSIGAQNSEEKMDASIRKIRWVDDVVEGLKQLGGRAHLDKIYSSVRKIRIQAGRSVPRSFEEVIRKELETHCNSSLAYQGRENYFVLADKGSGVWALKD